MSQTVTLELPDTIYQPVQRMADATRRPLTEVLVDALRASLPPIEGLPPALAAELVSLEQLDDDTLWHVMLSQLPAEQQRKLERLLRKNKSGKLATTERAGLAELQNQADRIMLRKARAAVLLRFRGQRLPTLAELRRLTQSKVK
jgi:predicted transcriptional regulator